MEIPNETFVQLDVKYHIISEMQCGLVCSNNIDCNGFQFQDSVCKLFQQAADLDLETLSYLEILHLCMYMKANWNYYQNYHKTNVFQDQINNDIH